MSGLWYYKQHFKDVFDDSLICSKEYVVSDGNVLRSTYKAFNETLSLLLLYFLFSN